MYWGLVGASGVAVLSATEFVPELNQQLRLVPFTWQFRAVLIAIMFADYAGCWVIEQGLKKYFSDYKPKDVARRRHDQLQREAQRVAKEQIDSERERLSKVKI